VLWLAGLVLLVATTALPARAEDFTALVGALGGDTFADKEQAVIALGKLGHGRAVAVLTALQDGRLLKAPDGRVLVSDAAKPSPDQAALLEKAIAAEKNPAVSAAMQQSLSAARLLSGSKEEKLAAARVLGATRDPQIKNLLDQFRATESDPELRQAADAALESIENRLRLAGLVANLFQGVSLGSVLLLAAIGLVITFGVMGVINMAHGEMIMLGAYAAYVCQQLFRTFLPPAWIDAYLVLAVPVAFVFAGAVGVALERSVIRFLYGRPLETLLATWGVSLILQQAVRSIFGAPNKEVSNPSSMTGGFDPIGGFTVTWNRVTIILFCFCRVGGSGPRSQSYALRIAYAGGDAESSDGCSDGHTHRAGRCADLRAGLGDRRHGRGGAEPDRQCQP
jgi:urea transport system permease protein